MDISYCLRLSTEDLIHVHHQLTSLQVAELKISYSSDFSHLTNLHHLDLSECSSINADIVRYFPTTLTSLSLARTRTTDEMIAKLPKSLRELTLNFCEWIRNLSSMERFTKLESLSLIHCGHLPNQALSHLPSSLKTLDISECYFTGEVFNYLSRLPKLQIVIARMMYNVRREEIRAFESENERVLVVSAIHFDYKSF